MASFDYDYIVIGSGFGGSVSAYRLTEKGYHVAVMEMGRRYQQKDFPKTNWDAKNYFWAPLLKCYGFFRMSLFKHVWVLSGVGVGGGSLVYANTLLEPPERVWDDPKWAKLNDWKQVMPAFYQRAKHYLGVTKNPYVGTADRLLKEAAEEEGIGDTFYTTDVGIYFGEKGKTVPDPYFDGKGPERTGCLLCGGCMVGCRYGSKNTLDKNYLYFAEKQGAEVFAETKVVDVVPLNGKEDGSEGYAVHTESSIGWFGKQKRVFYTKSIVFSAGVLGTVNLLMQLKAKQSLPHLSDQLGHFVRTNSESIIGVRTEDQSIDASDGVAIGSGIYIDEDTHIEAVRYSKGSDAMGLTATLLTHGTPGIQRIISWFGVMLKNPWRALKALYPLNFAKSSIILLVMQTMDTHVRMRLKRSWLFPFRKKLQTEGNPIPTYIPAANQFAEKMAKRVKGTPLTALTEIFLNVPTTAHILGGAAMGDSAETGVIDGQNRVYGYQNLYICDGSMIGANLGVNPSLTITALTEHAMSHIPEKEAQRHKGTEAQSAIEPPLSEKA